MFRQIPVGNSSATLVNHPIRYNGAVPPLRHMPMHAGEDTETILAEIGYHGPDIDKLIAAGAVSTAKAPSENGETV
ncbi:MAG: hypothetical protein MI741_10850 [Rhodospirillales bacterium]|nr:hypothetical protein [Rhodospirillales bacterium]